MVACILWSGIELSHNGITAIFVVLGAKWSVICVLRAKKFATRMDGQVKASITTLGVVVLELKSEQGARTIARKKKYVVG